MSPKVKYRNTDVPVLRSVQAIEKAIVRYGARSFTKEFEGNRVVGVRFTIDATDYGVPDLPIVMEAPVDTVLDRVWNSYSERWREMEENTREGYRDQAERIAWRHLKDLTEHLLAAFDVGVVDPITMLFGMVEVTHPETGHRQTMARLARDRGILQPAAGGRLLLKPGS